MANKVRAAHDALAALLAGQFPGTAVARNPGGHIAPKLRQAGQLERYLAQGDDQDPEVNAVVLGPVYDLIVRPCVTLAYAGGTKDEREVRAYAELDLIVAALAADRTLGGVVGYAEIDACSACDAEGAVAWLAGGLDIHISLLIGGCATRAG